MNYIGVMARLDERRAPVSNATVGYLVDRWLEVTELEVSTRDGYEGYIRTHIRPVPGDLPLRKLTVDVLDCYYAHLRARGRRCQRCIRRAQAGQPPLRTGERYRPRPDAAELVHEPDCARGLPLAPSSVRQVHFILRAALNAAVRWGWLPSNPAELARPPRSGHYDPHPPSPEDVARLVDAAWPSAPGWPPPCTASAGTTPPPGCWPPVWTCAPSPAASATAAARPPLACTPPGSAPATSAPPRSWAPASPPPLDLVAAISAH
jgi:hypothetical protein